MIGLINWLEEGKKNGIITDYRIETNLEDGVYNIYIIPTQVVENINMTFTISKDGIID